MQAHCFSDTDRKTDQSTDMQLFFLGREIQLLQRLPQTDRNQRLHENWHHSQFQACSPRLPCSLQALLEGLLYFIGANRKPSI